VRVRHSKANMIDKILDTKRTAMLTSRRFIYLAVQTVGQYNEALMKTDLAANIFNRKIRWSRR
jgi:hypothetical protein